MSNEHSSSQPVPVAADVQAIQDGDALLAFVKGAGAPPSLLRAVERLQRAGIEAPRILERAETSTRVLNEVAALCGHMGPNEELPAALRDARSVLEMDMPKSPALMAKSPACHGYASPGGGDATPPEATDWDVLASALQHYAEVEWVGPTIPSIPEEAQASLARLRLTHTSCMEGDVGMTVLVRIAGAAFHVGAERALKRAGALLAGRHVPRCSAPSVPLPGTVPELMCRSCARAAAVEALPLEDVGPGSAAEAELMHAVLLRSTSVAS